MLLNQVTRFAMLSVMLAGAVASDSTAAPDASDVNRINFSGGTVAEYIEVIRRTNPDLNVILMPDAATVRLPAINVSSPERSGAFPESLLRILELVTAASVEDDIVIHSDGVHYVVRLELPRAEATAAAQKLSPAYVHTYSLAEVLVKDHMDADVVLKSIEAALDLRDGEPIATAMSFHEPTSMLLVRGTTQQHNLIGGTLNQLRRTAAVKQAEAEATHERQQLTDAQQLAEQLKEELTKRDESIERILAMMRELDVRLRSLERRGQQ